jgi:hypothetical protein
MNGQVLRFQLRELKADDFETELYRVWNDFQRDLISDEDLRRRLENARIPPNDIQGCAVSDLFEVRQCSAGLTGLETVLVNVAAGIALKLFEVFILPELRRGKKTEAIQESGREDVK